MKISPDSPLARKLVAQGRVKASDLPKGHKYHAVPALDSKGHLHPSRLQARKTDQLRAGALVVIPEVSLPLTDNGKRDAQGRSVQDRIRIDALVIDQILEDGRFVGRWVEIKGRDLAAGRKKRQRFEAEYGIPIQVITK